ncbi:unnamed protein product, partial [marine sediment metagenome]
VHEALFEAALKILPDKVIAGLGATIIGKKTKPGQLDYSKVVGQPAPQG